VTLNPHRFQDENFFKKLEAQPMDIDGRVEIDVGIGWNHQLAKLLCGFNMFQKDSKSMSLFFILEQFLGQVDTPSKKPQRYSQDFQGDNMSS
jgi:hypothetical protein